jgi:hypothetical protein
MGMRSPSSQMMAKQTSHLYECIQKSMSSMVRYSVAMRSIQDEISRR